MHLTQVPSQKTTRRFEGLLGVGDGMVVCVVGELTKILACVALTRRDENEVKPEWRNLFILVGTKPKVV
jgi:hypothetical protein